MRNKRKALSGAFPEKRALDPGAAQAALSGWKAYHGLQMQRLQALLLRSRLVAGVGRVFPG
ncbi:MAG: hypothetical protein ABFD98_08300 [Syntrophobacteraceae bacterium]|nr:hypothetical protein [Desulfobacteraceae bacterium]